jgi:PAS domain S-box-containing protein
MPSIGCALFLTNVIALHGSFPDTSEERMTKTAVLAGQQTEEALRQSEERFRGAFDYTAIGMAMVGLDGRWLGVNRSLCEIVGYSEEELLGLTFQDITHPDDLDADLAHARAMMDGTIRYYHMEKRYLRKDGQIVFILLSVSLVHDADGNPLYFVS